MTPLELLVIVGYAALLSVLTVFGIHRYGMTFLFFRHRYKLATPLCRFEELPLVTVQLPIYNELYVAERLLEAVARLDYPRERLEVQVLDDSTDETRSIARACVERLRRGGLDIVYLPRADRTGFKAGALDRGLRAARGEFVAIFDADFVPDPAFLRRTIHHFTDGAVGLVQTRWGHLNRTYSALTRAQAVFLDGHFLVEHLARNRSGRFFNFNGTAGIWRRRAIEESGGWQHDTITEDLDLSFRAQLAGWRFVYLPDIVTPAELPVDMNAFKLQQHRWAKGAMQCALKLLGPVWRADLPGAVKREAVMHLTANLAYLVVIPLAILLPITTALRSSHGPYEVLLVDVPLFAAATLSVVSFYVVGQRAQGYSFWDSVKPLPLVMALGIGLSVNNARAVVEALMGYQTGFVRTPKHGVRTRRERAARPLYHTAATLQPVVELVLAAYMTYAVVYFLERGIYSAIPFLVLFQVGFGYVGLVSVYEGVRGWVSRWVKLLSPTAAGPE
ncbi:MAG TPA: glycosyltransferase [Anaeromyxobacter sp.]|nr:glycosyltransferase [Anaeromyxobacter sp.]